MKRLLLRIAALGTVVVLGLIAIAQAQRGTEEMPPAPGGFAATGDRFSPDEAPAVAPANRLRAAEPIPTNRNPLRTETRRAMPVEGVPAANVLTASHQQPVGAAGHVAEGPLMRSPSADPFGFQAGGGPPPRVPDVGQEPPTAADALGARSPDTPPRRLPFPEAHNPQRLAPLAAADPSSDTAIASDARRPAVDDAYPELPGRAPQVGQPAQLKANPFATPAGLPVPNMEVPANFDPPGSQALASGVAPAGEGTGQPGSKQLEGPQSPQLTIQKSAPPAIQVGEVAKFRVTVRNTGSVAAHQVEVRDQTPKGARLISTTPRASRGAGGELVWALGTLQPGDESSVEIQLEPITEGEIGSVAMVRFQADASARSVVTKPELVIKTSAPEQVLSGEEITLTIEVSNPGSGTATGVVLEEHIPVGLQHPGGSDLEYQVGDLPPGESRKLQLTLLASRPGPLTNVLTAHADGNLRAKDRLDLEVVSPQLEVAVEGPKRRYLEREATYQLSVHNPGSAAAKEIELVAYLPTGLKFVSANNSGHYEEAARAVHWRLEELPTSARGSVELVTLPIEPGEQTIRLHGTADRGISADGEQAVLVEGIAAIKFEIVDVTDPIEVGGETIYEIRVVNQGSKAATNVRLAVTLPGEMRAVAGEGPTRHVLNGNRVLFEGLPRLAPKADTTYRVRAQGVRPGDLRIRAQLLTNEMETPVTKEESTRVYSDQ